MGWQEDETSERAHDIQHVVNYWTLLFSRSDCCECGGGVVNAGDEVGKEEFEKKEK